MLTRLGDSPILIIGMHRSGTSMISRLLEKMGLFLGKNKDVNNEAEVFRYLNKWLLHQSGVSWDHPEPFEYLLLDEDIRVWCKDYISLFLSSPRMISYLGIKKYLSYKTTGRISSLWGWKDPVSTYTLPIWLELFPKAKVIHIYRHGIDVANSLQRREKRARWSRVRRYERFRIAYHLWPKKGGFTNTIRCASLEGGFSLWEEYIGKADKHVSFLGEQAMSIKYENFLAEPYQKLQNLARFCGLPVDLQLIEEIASSVKPERSHAYKESAELKKYAKQVEDRLGKWGY